MSLSFSGELFTYADSISLSSTVKSSAEMLAGSMFCEYWTATAETCSPVAYTSLIEVILFISSFADTVFDVDEHATSVHTVTDTTIIEISFYNLNFPPP